jgi:hypothetical protein
MNKAFLVILTCLSSCIFLDCKKGITDQSNLATTSTNINVVLPTQGLVAYYPFNGNADDASGNGYHGTVHGASLATDRFGLGNSAYSFNGTNNYIDLGDILDNVFCADTAQFSVSGWTYIKSYNPNGGNIIIGKASGGPGPYQWLLSYNSDGTLTGGVFSDSTVNNYQVKYASVSTNQWIHFVLIFDGKQPVNGRIQIYVNNTLITQSYQGGGTLGTSTKNTSISLIIGGQNHYPSPQNLFDGFIDDIRIYNRPLTQAEIDILYHVGGWTGN